MSTDRWTAGYAVLAGDRLIKDQTDAAEAPRVTVYGSPAEAQERIAEMVEMFPENTYEVVELTWEERHGEPDDE